MGWGSGNLGCSGGGSAKLPAIYVQYPEGSICTCTNGDKTYTAKDSTGFWLFAGLSIGTWTVTATDPADPSDPASETVEITTEGQSVSVELSYSIVLYKPGMSYADTLEATSYTESGTSFTGTMLGVTDNGTYLTCTVSHSSGNRGGSIWSKDSIDFSKVNKISVKVKLNAASNADRELFLQISAEKKAGYTVSAQVAAADNATEQTLELDVSGINGTGYALLEMKSAGVSHSFNIYDWIAE